MAADVNKTIQIAYVANTTMLERALGRMPNITDTQAKKMAVGLDKEMRKMEKSAARSAKKSREAWKKFGKGALELGAGFAAVGAGAVFIAQKFADMTNELVDLSAKTNISRESLAGLRLAAKGSGLQLTDLESGLISFQNSMVAAERPTSKQAKAFDELKVKARDSKGELKDADTVFNEVTAELAKMEDGTKKNTIAMALFGKTGGASLIQSGALSSMQAYKDLAVEFGTALTDEATASAATFQRQMANLETVSTGAMEALMASITGGDSGQGINFLIEGLTQGIIYFSSIGGDAIALVSQSFEDMIGMVQAAIMALSGDTTGAKELMRALSEETTEAGENAFNMFERANAKVARFDELVASTNQTVKQGAEEEEKANRRREASAKARAKAEKERLAQIKAQEDARKQLDALNREVWTSEASEMDKINRKYEEKKEKILSLGPVVQDQAEVEFALTEQARAQETELNEYRERVHYDMQRLSDEASEKRQDDMKRERALTVSFASTLSSSFGDTVNALQTIMEAQGDANKENMIRIYRAQQIGATASIAIKVAEGMMNATAAYIGRPIALAIAQSAVLASGAAQTAAVWAVPPPVSKHTGGYIGSSDGKAPDERNIRALTGEAILDRSTVRNLGGEQGVRQLREGAPQQVFVISPWKHLDRYNKSALRKNTALRSLKTARGMRGY